MNEAWGAVVAAVAAGVFGIIGILAGIYVGRRQTVDQAAVEHGQWLRGQRQEAYLQLLDAFDTALLELQTLVGQWEYLALRADQQGHADEFEEIIDTSVGEATEGLTKPLERAHLLGPEPVEQAVEALDNWVDDVAVLFHQQAQPGTGPNWDWSTFQIFVARGHTLRRNLMLASKAALRTPPTPGR